jgi:hypothetical protein
MEPEGLFHRCVVSLIDADHKNRRPGMSAIAAKRLAQFILGSVISALAFSVVLTRFPTGDPITSSKLYVMLLCTILCAWPPLLAEQLKASFFTLGYLAFAYGVFITTRFVPFTATILLDWQATNARPRG